MWNYYFLFFTQHRIRNLSYQICADITNYIDIAHANQSGATQDQTPTAVLLASVNTPDHSVLFEQLRGFIAGRGGHVALIETGTNTSSVKTLIASVVQQFTSCEGQAEEATRECGENAEPSPPKRSSPPKRTAILVSTHVIKHPQAVSSIQDTIYVRLQRGYSGFESWQHGFESLRLDPGVLNTMETFHAWSIHSFFHPLKDLLPPSVRSTLFAISMWYHGKVCLKNGRNNCNSRHSS